MIKPTVGRVVLYFDTNAALAYNGPFVALVCYVHSNTMVNLCVFDGNGVPTSKTSVHLHQPDSKDVPANFLSSWCEWMPYQVGQAAKTESAEAKLAQALKAEAAAMNVHPAMKLEG